MWSSSYRGRTRYASDSDSDSDANKIANKPESNDARLIREMDLSRRHETVDYRPNPWRIARINAASRPCPAKPVQVQTTTAQPKPIVETFKKRARHIKELGGGVDTAYATKNDPLPARQGQGTALPQARGSLQPPPVEAPAKPRSTLSDYFAPRRTVIAHRPVSPRKPQSNTHRAIHSSPVRLAARPTGRHSTPGPRSVGPGVPCRSAHTSPSLPPLQSGPLPARTNVHGANVNTNTFVENPARGPPSWLSDALDQIQGARGASGALAVVPEHEHRQDATDHPHIRTPKPRHKRPGSPELNRAPRKTPCVVAPPLCLDASEPATSSRPPTAYAFGQDDDPDSEWSTLARTKGKSKTGTRSTPKLGGMRQSGGFRLPLLGVPSRVQKTAIRSTEVRRVVTYLPPPRTSDDGPQAKHARVDAIAYESVDGKPLASEPADHRAEIEQEEEEEIEDIRLPDSDMTLVNEDEQDVVKIDVDDVCVRYPATRACMKTVSRVRKAMGCVVELRVSPSS